MSSIATLRLLPLAAVPRLLEALTAKKSWLHPKQDKFRSALTEEGPEGTFPWSGYMLYMAMQFLEERGIDLLSSEMSEFEKQISSARGGTFFTLTARHRDLYQTELTRSFDDAELVAFDNEFNETQGNEAAEPMRAGIAAIRSALGHVDDSSFVLIEIS